MDISLLQRIIHRPDDTHKYNFGHVLILGGSPGMVGAPLLCGKAALRIGAGLVTIAADALTVDKLDRRVEEIMTFAIQDDPVLASDALLKFITKRKVNSVVIGPGLKQTMGEVAKLLVPQLRLPIVLDAGGLTTFSTHLAQLQDITQHNQQIIVTPHAGEYARLSGSPTTQPDELRQQAVQFAKNYHLTVVLKGNHTIVARPDGSHYENQTGNPGLATAGTGDVLSGVIAGLLAQGITYTEAAELGVYIHGLSGDLAADVKTQAGLIASDVTEFLPKALATIADR